MKSHFDDKHWTVRYLVMDTGNWLTGTQILVSPYAVSSVDHGSKSISVDLTKKQIEGGPSLESHKPVSRQFEDSYYSYFGWPSYWDGPRPWGSYYYASEARDHWDRVHGDQPRGDRHLRSTKDVAGHRIQARDGEIGHVEDFVVDDASWTIRYLVVDTTNWWPGRKVLISPVWIDAISWVDAKVSLLLSREEIRKSPEYGESALLERGYEEALHKHYNRDGYWNSEHVSVRG